MLLQSPTPDESNRVFRNVVLILSFNFFFYLLILRFLLVCHLFKLLQNERKTTDTDVLLVGFIYYKFLDYIKALTEVGRGAYTKLRLKTCFVKPLNNMVVGISWRFQYCKQCTELKILLQVQLLMFCHSKREILLITFVANLKILSQLMFFRFLVPKRRKKLLKQSVGIAC